MNTQKYSIPLTEIIENKTGVIGKSPTKITPDEELEIIKARVEGITTDRRYDIINQLEKGIILWGTIDIEIHQELIRTHSAHYADAIIKSGNDNIIKQVFDDLIISLKNNKDVFPEDFKDLVMQLIGKIQDKSIIYLFDTSNMLREIIGIETFNNLINLK